MLHRGGGATPSWCAFGLADRDRRGRRAAAGAAIARLPEPSVADLVELPSLPSRSPSSRSPTRACSRAATRRGYAETSTRTRSSSRSARPTWRRASSRASRSPRAARPARPWPRQPVRARSSTGVSAARVRSAAFSCRGPACSRNLPQAALAAVVIAAVIGLDRPRRRPPARTRRARRTSRSAIARSLGVALFGVLSGIGIADRSLAARVPLARVASVRRRRSAASTGLQGLPRRRAISRGDARRRASSCTASTRRSSSPMRASSGSECCALRRRPQPVRVVVVAAEPITDVDTTAADMLIELARRARASAASNSRSPR